MSSNYFDPQKKPENINKDLMKNMQNNNLNKPYDKVLEKDLFKRILAIILAVLIAGMVFFIGFITSSLTKTTEEKAFKWALEQVEDYYMGDIIDGVGPYTSEDYLRYGFDALFDNYSTLLTPTEVSAVYSSMGGSESGMGIKMKLVTVGEEEFLGVAQVVLGSPAEGLLFEGDLLLEINDVKVALVNGIVVANLNGVNEKIKINRPKYNSVTDKIEYEELTVMVASRAYTASYVKYIDSDMSVYPSFLDNSSAYIKIDGFNYPADEEFVKAMNEMKSENRTNLILDLRGNPGGYLDICATITSYLVASQDDKTPPILMKTRDKFDKTSTIYMDTSHYNSMSFDKIVVLIDDGSASASEVLLKAMIDYGTVDIVVGTNSYGKGIMQTTMVDNATGYGITLTSAEWLGPLGVGIHKVGLQPSLNFEIENNDNNYPYSYDNDSVLVSALGYINA